MIEIEEYKKFIGKSVFELAEELNAKNIKYRIIRPGQATTMEIRMDRVTINVDAEKKITALRTG